LAGVNASVGMPGGRVGLLAAPAVLAIMHHGAMTEYRAVFDAEVTFLNGGGLQAQGFKLDVPDPQITQAELASLFVRQLGLLMTERVTLRAVRVVQEPHKGLGGHPQAPGLAPGPPVRLVELSHAIAAGMTTYPGLPGPEITPYMTREASRDRYAAGTEFAIDHIAMLGNTGTYLDSPYHRYAGGADLADLPLSALADLPAVVVRLADSGHRGVDVAALAAFAVAGRAVLLQTGWDRHWGSDRYGQDAPYLTGAGARWLADHRARLVGIDSVNIDDAADGERPAHSLLLAAGIPVVEHLTGLDQVPATGARFTATPPRLRAFGSFPVRAFASVPRASPPAS
jgi:kynurenine formamidase